jgi:hypothetical protein
MTLPASYVSTLLNLYTSGVGDIGGAQGGDILEEPPCIRRIEVLFGIRGAHGRDQRARASSPDVRYRGSLAGSLGSQ